jgi:hypothetical protein
LKAHLFPKKKKKKTVLNTQAVTNSLDIIFSSTSVSLAGDVTSDHPIRPSKELEQTECNTTNKFKTN